jgi:predicted NBD/HSP70 family sugar kinase
MSVRLSPHRKHSGSARLLNDAEVQGLGIIRGKGLEVVRTLGTGIVRAIFSDGRLAPHLELAQHPIHHGETHDDYIGNDARRSIAAKKWNRRVERAIGIVHTLLNYDHLYLGGGNAARLTIALARNVHTASNDAGLTGGVRLRDKKVWKTACGHPASGGATLKRVSARARKYFLSLSCSSSFFLQRGIVTLNRTNEHGAEHVMRLGGTAGGIVSLRIV